MKATKDEGRLEKVNKEKKKETSRNSSLIDTNGKNNVELNCSEGELPTYGMAESNHHSAMTGRRVKSLLILFGVLAKYAPNGLI